MCFIFGCVFFQDFPTGPLQLTQLRNARSVAGRSGSGVGDLVTPAGPVVSVTELALPNFFSDIEPLPLTSFAIKVLRSATPARGPLLVVARQCTSRRGVRGLSGDWAARWT